MGAIGPEGLPEFVSKTDSLGGPGHPQVSEYWSSFTYKPSVDIDVSLDPFGTKYLDSQLALYREMSNRELDQGVNEHTTFNREDHLRSRNPYNHANPAGLATQMVQLATAMRLARPKRGARMVDMGCGWGLSSELGSYLGLQVEAVDINSDFVSLVHDRSVLYNYDIATVHASFDSYSTTDPVDLFLFYECLHHAVEPWALIARLTAMLNPGGKIVACGEPINTEWWPHWGLRLDPISVYCIHKYGWFESGWSLEFIVRCFEKALLNVEVVTHPDPNIGKFVVAKKNAVLDVTWLNCNTVITGGELHGSYIVASDATSITFPEGIGNHPSTLLLQNFRPRPIRMTVELNNGGPSDLILEPGETSLPLDLSGAGTTLRFTSETWRPSEEVGNLDPRLLSFHINGLIPGAPAA